MIKAEFLNIEISGHPAVITAEFENLAREVRYALCKSFGEDFGLARYEEAIKGAEKDQHERSREIEASIAHMQEEMDPEIVKLAEKASNELFRKIFGRNI